MSGNGSQKVKLSLHLVRSLPEADTVMALPRLLVGDSSCFWPVAGSSTRQTGIYLIWPGAGVPGLDVDPYERRLVRDQGNTIGTAVCTAWTNSMPVMQ